MELNYIRQCTQEEWGGWTGLLPRNTEKLSHFLLWAVSPWVNLLFKYPLVLPLGSCRTLGQSLNSLLWEFLHLWIEDDNT